MDAEYDELLSAYEEQITALVDAGVDLLIAETMIGADETMAVIDAAHAVCDLPILCSLTMQADGSQGIAVYDMTPEYFGKSMKRLVDLGASMVGGCCGTDPSYIKALVNAIR